MLKSNIVSRSNGTLTDTVNLTFKVMGAQLLLVKLAARSVPPKTVSKIDS
jgi:hypothetical protein